MTSPWFGPGSVGVLRQGRPSLIDILRFPLGVFIEAFVGVLQPAEIAKMRRCRTWALISLAGGVGVFSLVLLLTTTDPHSLSDLTFRWTFGLQNGLQTHSGYRNNNKEALRNPLLRKAL